MARLSAKLRPHQCGFEHWCPACEKTHIFYVSGAANAGMKVNWKFDGNLERPTFTPSMKITGKQTIQKDGVWTGGWVRDAAGNTVDYCCHYILTAGRIQFCGDCTHALKGQTVELPDLPA